jgi:predicted ATPase
VEQFHQKIDTSACRWAEASTAPFFQSSPFFAAVEILRELAACRGDAPVSEQIEQLESSIISAGVESAESVALIAPLLNLPVPEKYPSLSLSPEEQRARLLGALVQLILGAARTAPLVIVIEDLHWVDPSSLELIQLVADQNAAARLLILLTARSEFHLEWPLRAHHTQLMLNHLGAAEVRAMVEQVAARRALSNDMIETLVERTGGVPLFVEELTQVVLEGRSSRLG